MGKGHILIVEDDDDWRSILTSYLKEIPATIKTVADYPAALQALRGAHFDILILDLRLDDKEDKNFAGMELLTYLRKQENHQVEDTNVIIISAYGTQHHIREGFKSYGLLDYIPKQNFNKKEYEEIIRNALIRKNCL